MQLTHGPTGSVAAVVCECVCAAGPWAYWFCGGCCECVCVCVQLTHGIIEPCERGLRMCWPFGLRPFDHAAQYPRMWMHQESDYDGKSEKWDLHNPVGAEGLLKFGTKPTHNSN